VTVWTLETLNEIARGGIPDANALVERTGSDILGVGRNGDGGDAVLNGKGENILSRLDVPKADSPVARTGGDGATITGEVKRVDVLLVAGERVADASRGNIPDLALLAIAP
jgi:hypothetical protein